MSRVLAAPLRRLRGSAPAVAGGQDIRQGAPRLAFLDGMRGWAAVMVLLYHVFCDGLPVDPSLPPQLRLLPPFNAIIGVYAFFLLSGFALARPFLASGDPAVILRTAGGRYPRLAIPVFAACGFVHIALVLGLILPVGDRWPTYQGVLTFDPTLAHLLRFALFDVFFAYRYTDTYIGPLWTMSVEFYGSALVFGLLGIGLLLRRLLVPAALAGGVLLAFSQPLALFALGLALAIAHRDGRAAVIPTWAGWALLVTGFVLPMLIPWTADARHMFATVAVCVGCATVPVIRTALESRLSRWLGEISFPLYLLHAPVIWIVGLPFYPEASRSVPFLLGLALVLVVASIGAAVAFVPVNTFALRVSRWVGRAVVAAIRRPRAAGG